MTTEERLTKVERELARVKRRSRWLLGGVLLAAGAWAALAGFKGSATAAARTEVEDRFQQAGEGFKVVRANRFVLEDEKGKNRAMLTTFADGAGLTLYDENSKARVMLGVSNDGPALFLYDEKGKGRARLAASNNGPGLQLCDEKGKTRAGLNVLKSGSWLHLRDENGKTIWRAP